MCKIFLALAVAFLTSEASAENLGFDVAREPQKAAEIYCAREGFLFYRLRMPDGSLRRLEWDFVRPGTLRGDGRWSGTVKGETVTVKTDPKAKGGATEFVFRRGRAFSVTYRGKTTNLDKVWTRPRYPDDESPLYACLMEPASVADENPDGKWQDGRLTFPYANPNQSALLYAGLGLLSLGLFLVRRRQAAVLGCLLSGVCLVLLFLTASRGGLLAFFIGAMPILALRFRFVFRTRWFWPALVGLAAIVSVWMSIAPPKLVTRGSGEGSSGWSNRLRKELWRAAPRMMMDAPSGWRIAEPGPSYVDWYQPPGNIAYTGSLMNDHLTRMASVGWFGRVAYVGGWALLLVLCGLYARRTGNGVPLGTWLALAVGAWFNPVTVGFRSVFVWLPAVLALWEPIVRRRWLTRALVIRAGLVAAGLTAVVFGGLVVLGLAKGPFRPSVRTEARRVMVNGANPTTWIVDDGFALGGLLFGRDIRGFYLRYPQAAPVGYVRRIADLPCRGVRRLVLAGRAGDEFLRKTCSDPSGPRGLPPELVFLSPPFPPQAVPGEVLRRSKVRLYVGEFATWYSDAYDQVPSWVCVRPGAALYLPGWMSLAMAPL